MKWRTNRRIIQLAALGLLFLPTLWPIHNIWIGSYLSSQIFDIALTDPLAALEVILAGKIIWAPLLWSLLPLLIVGMILGRIFCSWICPLANQRQPTGRSRSVPFGESTPLAFQRRHQPI